MQVSHAPRAAHVGTAALALLLAVSAQADGRGRNPFPQLTPATPAALVGSCESLLTRLAGLHAMQFGTKTQGEPA